MFYQSPIEHLKGVNAKGKVPSNKCASEDPDSQIFIYEDRKGSSSNNNKVFGRDIEAVGGKTGHSEFDRGRGGIVRGRGGFDRGQWGFIRGRGGFDRGRGGIVRGRGGFDGGQWGFIRGRGGFDRGRGGIVRDRGGFDRGQGGFIRGRGGFIVGRGGGFDRGQNLKKIDELHTKPSKDLTEIVQKVPIFTLDEKLKDKLEEFCGWSLQELFVYVKCLHGIARGKTMDTLSWSELDRSLLGKVKNDITAKKIIWKKLKQKLPTPTLKESLKYCKMYVLRENVTKDFGDVPQHLQPPDTLQDLIQEEVKSVFGECEVPGKKLIEKLGTAGEMVIHCKRQNKFRKYFLSLFRFLKQFPENSALHYPVVCKKKNVRL